MRKHFIHRDSSLRKAAPCVTQVNSTTNQEKERRSRSVTSEVQELLQPYSHERPKTTENSALNQSVIDHLEKKCVCFNCDCLNCRCGYQKSSVQIGYSTQYSRSFSTTPAVRLETPPLSQEHYNNLSHSKAQIYLSTTQQRDYVKKPMPRKEQRQRIIPHKIDFLATTSNTKDYVNWQDYYRDFFKRPLHVNVHKDTPMIQQTNYMKSYQQLKQGQQYDQGLVKQLQKHQTYSKIVPNWLASTYKDQFKGQATNYPHKKEYVKFRTENEVFEPKPALKVLSTSQQDFQFKRAQSCEGKKILKMKRRK